MAEHPMKGNAEFSACRRYRYLLSRAWDPTRPCITWVMLNPSTADAREDDPTIRRCVSFSKKHGAGWLLVANLFAFRTTDPRRLLKVEDPVGLYNLGYLKRAVVGASMVFAAWGAIDRRLWDAAAAQVLQVRENAPRLHCLGVTKNRSPRHPLYVKGDTDPIEWTGP